jgi:hypothetical protein
MDGDAALAMRVDDVVAEGWDRSIVFELLPSVVFFGRIARHLDQNQGVEGGRPRARTMLLQPTGNDRTIRERRQAYGLDVDSQVRRMHAAWTIGDGVAGRAAPPSRSPAQSRPSMPSRRTRSPRRVSPNVEEPPNAEMPMGPDFGHEGTRVGRSRRHLPRARMLRRCQTAVRWSRGEPSRDRIARRIRSRSSRSGHRARNSWSSKTTAMVVVPASSGPRQNRPVSTTCEPRGHRCRRRPAPRRGAGARAT